MKNKTKQRCALLFTVMIVFYLLDNLSLASRIGAIPYNYVIKPVLWLGAVFLVLQFPRPKLGAKIRFREFINLWAFNFAVIQIVLLVFAGLLEGFGRSPYSHSLRGITLNIVYVGSMLIGKEFIRSYLVNSMRKDDNYASFVLIAICMTLGGFSLSRYGSIGGFKGWIQFTGQYLVPEFSQNLFAAYLTFLGGQIPSIIYMGIIEAFQWLSPVLPDLKWITTALIGTLCPVFSMVAMQNIYLRESKSVRRYIESENPIGWIVTSIAAIAIIWFAVGVFRIYPSVIATGSMEPMIKPGDVILVDKGERENFEVGDVIQFKRGDILISHRIIEIVREKKEVSYRTKGDNNPVPDNELVKTEQIKGKIINVIPKIGWPALLIRSRRNIPIDEVISQKYNDTWYKSTMCHYTFS